MTAALLYFAVALAIAALFHRVVQPFTRRAAIVLLLLPLAFTGKALLTGRVYAPIDLPMRSEPLASLDEARAIGSSHNGVLSDVYSHNIPWKAAVRAAYASGEWPLWNPYILAGDVLAATAQPAPYEPIFLTSLALPFANSLTYLATMQLFVAGLVMFVFLRDLECSVAAALVGAAAWMFSWHGVFWLEWAVGMTTIWLPLILAGVRRCVREQSLAAMGLLTAALALMLLAGHPESALHMTFIGLLWAAGELIATRARPLLRATLLGLGAGVLALMLTAIFVLPIVDAIPQTHEHHMRESVFTGQAKSVSSSTMRQRLIFQLLPFRYGDAAGEFPKEPPHGFPENAYAGTLVLPLAAIGFGYSRRRSKWLLAALGLFGLVLGIAMAPFADWIAMLPLFDIAINTRLIFATSFAVAVLAAFGLDVVLAERRFKLLAASAAIVFALLAALCAAQWPAMREWGLSAQFVWSRTIALLLQLAIMSLVARMRTVAWVLLALIVAQRAYESAHFYPTLPASVFYPRHPLLDRIPPSDEPFRITGKGLRFYPNMSAVYRLEDVRGYTAMTNRMLRMTYPLWCETQPIWWNRVDDLQRPFLSMLNVRYALTAAAEPVPDGWKSIGEWRGTRLVENERVLPRAFVPRSVRINLPHGVLGGQMFAETDFGSTAWLQVEGAPSGELNNGPATVTIERDGMRAFKLHTSAKNATWVVVSETAWNGWRVFIDGKSEKLRRANMAFFAFYAPPGEHNVRIEYLPQSFVAGRRISFVTVVGIVVFAIVRYTRRKAALA